MENWERHFHLSGGHCFEMYFSEYKSTIRFKVKSQDGMGNILAINCATGEEFEFNKNGLFKKDYFTLEEIDCKNCNSN